MRLHSLLSPKCGIRPSRIHGHGVFANDVFKKGEVVSLWGGKVYTLAEVEDIAAEHPHFLSHPISIYEGYYLGSTSLTKYDDAEMFNHKCDANAGVKGQILLVARRRILRDEEVFFDYDTTETSAVAFRCRCGARRCRKLVDGSAWKDSRFQKKNRGFFSWYVAELIKQQRKQLKGKPNRRQ